MEYIPGTIGFYRVNQFYGIDSWNNRFCMEFKFLEKK